MALRMAMLKCAAAGENVGPMFVFRRWAHAVALPPPMDGVMASPPIVLPDFDYQNPDKINDSENIGFPGCFSFFGSMELMAVPKRKVSPHKRGIRNGPRALKPIPVIIRCKSCGRVKLPHFYCCSGERGKTGEQNN